MLKLHNLPVASEQNIKNKRMFYGQQHSIFFKNEASRMPEGMAVFINNRFTTIKSKF